MDRSRPFDPGAVKRAIVEMVRTFGQADVRVTRAVANDRTRARLDASFARGDLATWPYDSSYARTASDPASLLEGARSMICVALAYRTAAPQPSNLQGRVSVYASSEDYHRRMLTLLRAVAAKLDEAAGRPVCAIACDTKPVAERAFAEASGLAWIGKHTNAIHPRLGSYVFLGEIATTLDLPADEPLKKHCGSCSRCIPACPTGAIRGDYTIDATRCISDLTQRTGTIPRELRAAMGTWVWGCDQCQDACPPNAHAVPAIAPNAPIAPETAAPALTRLLRLRSSEFKHFYARSAMGWRGAAVLRRNAAVALGNALDRSTVSALAEALQDDPHPMVRGHAAWALGRIGSPAALRALTACGVSEIQASVREEIAAALEPFAPRRALHPS